MAKVELKGIGKVYDGNVRAVDNANITIEDQEFGDLILCSERERAWFAWQQVLLIPSRVPIFLVCWTCCKVRIRWE